MFDLFIVSLSTMNKMEGNDFIDNVDQSLRWVTQSLTPSRHVIITCWVTEWTNELWPLTKTRVWDPAAYSVGEENPPEGVYACHRFVRVSQKK